MPKKRSIKTSSPSDFEPKRKNPISLGSDSNIDKDFKPLKIGGKSTGLEFADGKILSSAEEFVTLKEKTEELQVSIIKGNKSAGFYTPQVIMQSKDATSPDAGLWFNIFTSGSTFIKTEGTGAATLSLEAQSSIYNVCGNDSSYGFIWWKGTFTTGTEEIVAKLHSTGQFVLAETTGGVANSAGYGQLYVKNESPNELYFRNDDNDVIQITSGSSLAGGGASALNDLSDVTYSSGDLTISSLDKIITSGDLTFECGGDITLDADGGDISIIDSSPSAAKPSFSITSTDSGGFGIFQSYYHNSSSPYQTDYLTYKSYTGKNDAGQDVTYSSDLYNPWSVVDGAEIGRYVKSIMANGTLSTGLQLTGQTDGSVDVLLGNGDGDVNIKSSLSITEKASANSDVGASGQLWVKNDTPNNLYFTDDTGQDVAITNNGSLAGGGSSEYYIRTTCRMRCQYNNWYWGTSTSYGENYYYFNSATGSSTSLPTSYQDSYATSWLVPKDSTVTAFKFVGTSTFGGNDTWEIALLRGQASGFGSAGNWSLSQIGSTQSVSTTTGVVEKWEQTGLSVSVNENDMVLPVFRRTTDNDSSYKFLQGTYIITLE